jgi:hypothetical protein
MAPAWLLVLVASVADLEAAVERARPGDDIVIAPGDYAVNLRLRRSGAPGAPVTLRAGGRVVLAARDPRLRVIEVEGARHWRLVGLALRGSRHANLRITESSGDIVVRDCEVFDAGKKGIIANGDDILIDHCFIHDIKQPVGGEDTQGIVTWARLD